MENKKTSGLAINNEAIIQIAGISALEVEGVAGLAKRHTQFKNWKSIMNNSRNTHSKSLELRTDNGAIILDIYITVFDNVRVKDVSESVQKNVKDKVQSMTGNAVAEVNVHVDDLVVSE